MLSWNLGLLDITAFVFYECSRLFVTHESTQRTTFLARSSVSTTLNTKLMVQVALCVWAELGRVTLEQRVSDTRTIPDGKCFRAEA